jgi:hypothetical protein
VSAGLALQRGVLSQGGDIPDTYDELFLDIGGADTSFYLPMQNDVGSVALGWDGRDGDYAASGITHEASGGPGDQPFVTIDAGGYARLLDSELPGLPTTAYTIVMWVRRTSTGGSGYATVINRDGGGLGKTVYTLIDPSDNLYHWSSWDSTLDVPLNQWKMVSMRFDQAQAGGTERFGVDTAYAERTGLGGFITWAGDRFFFGDTVDLMHPFRGGMCRVGMIGRYLSDSELDDLYAMGIV